jgi:uncharacterized protein (DUF433 family)
VSDPLFVAPAEKNILQKLVWPLRHAKRRLAAERWLLDRSQLNESAWVLSTSRSNSRMSWQERILINPAVRSGKPCVKDTRITVYDVLEYLAGGMSEDEILKDFPDLTRDDIRACLAFAAARERRLVNSVA